MIAGSACLAASHVGIEQCERDATLAVAYTTIEVLDALVQQCALLVVQSIGVGQIPPHQFALWMAFVGQTATEAARLRAALPPVGASADAAVNA